MMRLGEQGTALPFQEDKEADGIDFGISGSHLFTRLHELCRQVAKDCMCLFGLPNERLDDNLDPISSPGVMRVH